MYERRAAPSLHDFFAEVEADDAEIKRDMDETEGVRVLTVHASKGLEAPIVFLPDTCEGPDRRNEPKLLRVASSDPCAPPLFAWAKGEAEALAAARLEARAAEERESRRLLYVAMTRAGQRLIVAGYTAQPPADDCWHNLVDLGLRSSMCEAPAPYGAEENVLRLGAGLSVDNDVGSGPARRPSALPPSWAVTKAPEEKAISSLKSFAARWAARTRPPANRQGTARAPRAANAAGHPRRGTGGRGKVLSPHSWRRYRRSFTHSARQKGRCSRQRARARSVFRPESKGEVPVSGVLRRPGGDDIPYSGRLDRLVVTQDAVLIADFKLDAPPFRPAADHVQQLALYSEALKGVYPDLPVRAFLVYLDGPPIFPLSDADIQHALAAVVASTR